MPVTAGAAARDVHPGTNLVLAAGRVTDPKPFQEDEDVYVRDTSGS
ncbi:hypothetical protein ABT373_06860 [Streptomyces sp. NPDC000070]